MTTQRAPQTRIYPILQAPFTMAFTDVMLDDQVYDLREWIRFISAPPAVLRSFANSIGFGAYTTIYGVRAERRFCQDAFEFFRMRDRKRAIDLYVRDAGIAYVYNFTRTGGAITGLELCISPAVGRPALRTEQNAEFLKAAQWLLPWFAGILTITICESEEVSVNHSLAFNAKQYFDMTVE